MIATFGDFIKMERHFQSQFVRTLLKPPYA